MALATVTCVVGWPSLAVGQVQPQNGSGQVATAPQDQESQPAIDPLAAQVVMDSANFLAQLKTVSFDWMVTSDDVSESGEKITTVESGRTSFRRGVGFVAQAERDAGRRDYYYDGSTFTVVSPDEKFYATQPFSGGYDALVASLRDRAGAILPVWTILSEELPGKVMEGKNSAAYLGTVLIQGEEADHIALSGDDEDLQVWITNDESAPFPLMLVGTLTDQPGSPQYHVYFWDWQQGQEIASDQFHFVPGSDFQQIAMPSLTDGKPQAMRTGEDTTGGASPDLASK